MDKEYIEREAAINALLYNTEGLYDALHIFEAQDRIEALAAADVAPVRRGRWIAHKTMTGVVYCSACEDVCIEEEWLEYGKWGHCPNCGARMDGGEGHG